MKPSHKALLLNKKWRLNNLYWIRNKEGKAVRFRMTDEQLEYYDNMHTRNIILKARQLGFTTEQCIIQLDAALFEGKQCGIICHNLNDARRLFDEKISYAYDRLPTELKQANPPVNDAAGVLKFTKGGYVYASVSFRGGTLDYLHISEFGKICAKFPEKAREIVTGAFGAVPLNGTITIESTAEGRSGYYFDFCQEAERLQKLGATLSKLDYRFFFFSWWKNAEYTLEANNVLPGRLIEYFDGLASKHGIHLTDGQKQWYAAQERTLGDDIKREYPSLPEEAFAQTVIGAYYAKQFSYLYAQGRITDSMPDNSHLPVYTYWDIGVGDSTTIWFIRKVGDEYHVIDYYENSGEGLRHYMRVLKEKGYNYAQHFAPHDIENREFGSDAKSRKDIAREGFDIDGERYYINFEVVPKSSVDTGIDRVREILPNCVFDAVKCEQGLKALESYKKEWNDKLGTWRDNPLHDWASHGADAFRYFAMSMDKKEYTTGMSLMTGLI